MPLTHINGHTCHYRVDGPDDAPVLMLSHSLGLSYEAWDPQAADCRRFFRVIRYDVRGHGASSSTPGDYTIEQLGLDALALADHLGAPRFAFCGLSIGGMIGQWLGVHARERLTHLVIANSSPRRMPRPLKREGARCWKPASRRSSRWRWDDFSPRLFWRRTPHP